jgi:hypothetical protein
MVDESTGWMVIPPGITNSWTLIYRTAKSKCTKMHPDANSSRIWNSKMLFTGNLNFFKILMWNFIKWKLNLIQPYSELIQFLTPPKWLPNMLRKVLKNGIWIKQKQVTYSSLLHISVSSFITKSPTGNMKICTVNQNLPKVQVHAAGIAVNTDANFA